MPVTPSPLAEHCLELFAPLGRIRLKRMFGGWGFYVDELFFALIAYDRLFLKVNDTTRPRFEAAGSEPFVYTAKDRQQVSLGYSSAPAEAMDSPAAMMPWARLGIEAALAARAKGPAAPKQPAVRTRAAAKRAASPGAKKPRPPSPKKRSRPA